VASSDPWTFLNAQNQYYQSYTTEAECKTEHQKYNITAGIVNPTDACVQRTAQQITASQVLKDNPTEVDAQKETPPDTSTYTLLAPIGDQTQIKTTNIGAYFNTIFQIAIGLCGVLAVIMIVISAVQYMGDESVFGKTEAKSGIRMALLGLIIAIGAYAILNTINPALTGKDGLSVDQVDIELEGDTDAPIPGNITPGSLPTNIICSGGRSNITTIANSFNGKMTYSQNIPKGQAGPNGTIKLDCSGYVNYVLKCAGVPFVNSGTAVIFNNAERVTSLTTTKVNGIDLKPGDLIGWKPSDDPRGNGHVMIYVGNGLVNDSHSPRDKPGKAWGSFPTDKYIKRIKWIKRS
jgi:putative Ca2+/H+ antiporter (TMEM165/GDT1 family)